MFLGFFFFFYLHPLDAANSSSSVIWGVHSGPLLLGQAVLIVRLLKKTITQRVNQNDSERDSSSFIIWHQIEWTLCLLRSLSINSVVFIKYIFVKLLHILLYMLSLKTILINSKLAITSVSGVAQLKLSVLGIFRSTWVEPETMCLLFVLV